VTFSPDGETLATIGKHQDTAIRLWNATTGKLIAPFGGQGHTPLWSCVSFSPDGRLLATGHYNGDNSIHLWEVATYQEVARLQGHHGAVTALAFAPDGRSLASGSGDATALVWDLTGRTASSQRRPSTLSPSQLKEYWKDLRSEDAPAAYRAVRALAADPARSVPFLAERLRQISATDPGELDELLENLTGSSEWLQQRRSVMVLEYSASPEAGQLLHVLAGTKAETRLAREARAALDRLSTLP
jgi:WD40 repeat protein